MKLRSEQGKEKVIETKIAWEGVEVQDGNDTALD